MNLKKSCEQALDRIGPMIRKTPLEPAYDLSRESGAEVWLKLECLQHTRSFKVRGAVNRLLTLTEAEKARGILTASTGNHGLATAYGLRQLGLKGTIYLPENASTRKVRLLRQMEADLAFYGAESGETEVFARGEARRQGRVYISPYNDPGIVAGQGTIAIELLEQLPELDAVFVPVGGGGLIGGVAGYLKAVRPEIRMIGCLPVNSPVMYECVQAGRIVPGTVRPTLSDGTAGGVEDGAITFDLCRRYVDDWVTVSEDEIEGALRSIFEQQSLVIEGSAGVGVAGFRSYAARYPQDGKKSVIILCGGNIDIDKFKQIVC